MVRQLLKTAAVAGALVLPFAVGCDRTVSEEREVKVKEDGTVIRETEKVTEEADGTVTKTESKEVDRPDDVDNDDDK